MKKQKLRLEKKTIRVLKTTEQKAIMGGTGRTECHACEPNWGTWGC